MPEVARVCKILANKHIIFMLLFPSFQDIGLVCCTVGAHIARSAGLTEVCLSIGPLRFGYGFSERTEQFVSSGLCMDLMLRIGESRPTNLTWLNEAVVKL